MPAKAVSQKQARLFGAACGGATKLKSMSKQKACEMVRGQKIKALPVRVKPKSGAK